MLPSGTWANSPTLLRNDMSESALRIRDVKVRPVNAPLPEPVRTASGDILTAPLVLLDLRSEDGVVGRSYLRCISQDVLGPLAALTATIGQSIAGNVTTPTELNRQLCQRYRLVGIQGLLAMAIAGIDMAAWDALAHANKAPLFKLLDGSSAPIPAYASYGMHDTASAVAVSEKAVESGFRGIKLKLGYPDAQDDLAVLKAVRSAVGDTIDLMIDYNQSLSVPEAIVRARLLADMDLLWIEEPTLAEDFAGYARIADESGAALQIGENWWGPSDVSKSAAADASRYAMFDAMKIGGVSGWLRAAEIAAAHGLPVSSHAFAEISGHLLAATPNPHWLEFLDTAAPVLQEAVRIENGCRVFSEQPGTDILWDESAVKAYQI